MNDASNTTEPATTHRPLETFGQGLLIAALAGRILVPGNDSTAIAPILIDGVALAAVFVVGIAAWISPGRIRGSISSVPWILIPAWMALLVLGPKRLPEVARSLGRGMAEFRRASSELRQSLNTPPEEPSEEKRSKAAPKPKQAAKAERETDKPRDG